MKARLTIFLLSILLLPSLQGRTEERLPIDEIISDIYNAVTEISETEYEQLQSDLYALYEHPIDLNNTSDEELSQLYFLSPQQIDDILAYADKHPFEALYELRLIPSLTDYEIRDLLPFVYIHPSEEKSSLPFREGSGLGLYPREIFASGDHELITRLDARNIEGFEGSDPMYVQTRYRFDYQRRVIFGAQLLRPAGDGKTDLQYGAYLQLRDIGHLHSLVAGNYQASFGQGLVLAPVFHSGKSAYVTSAGQPREGLRYYSSSDGEGLSGVGATMRWNWGKNTRLDVSAMYSLKQANDSTRHHLIGANMTLRHKQLQVELTAIENIWSDSIRPYRNTAYNRHYFRGRNQAVLGASFRYNHGWFDLFGEVATTQNNENLSTLNFQLSTRDKWGIGTLIGCRFYPISGLALLALYRYYSPYFDNALGYAFSETSRVGDENGGYLGFDISRLKNWRFSGYGDVFYFSGPKYGIPESPTIGYDAMVEIQYSWAKHPSFQGGDGGRLALRLRARKKGESIYSARAQFDWSSGGWSLRTTADANLTPNPLTPNPLTTYGVSLAQDISYSLPLRGGPGRGLSFHLRLQGFDARNWANRIYLYEHDVLYAFSIPATYGLGGRAYLCLRWQIVPQVAMYLRVSETVYAKSWAYDHDRPQTRTDVHLLLLAKF